MTKGKLRYNQLEDIPVVLTELTDASVNFIRKEEYEKALVLLQKAHGILEIVNFCTRG